MSQANGAQLATQSQARPGNSNALKHSAFGKSKKVLAMRRRRVQYRVRMLFDGDIHRGIPPVAPWLTTADRPLAERWAWAKDIADTMTGYLEEVGLVAGTKDNDLVIRSLEDRLRKWVETEMKLSDRLGLNPMSRSQLRLSTLQGDHLSLNKWAHGNGSQE